MTMCTWGPIRPAAIAAAVLAGLLSPIVAGSAPAVAHTGFTSIADDANADQTVTGINGTTVKVRVLRPTSGKPSAGWPLVVYMPGDLKNRCANVNEDSSKTSWYTRKQMAEHGFAVLSFNARGLPASYNAGLNPSGTTGCDKLGDSTDAIDDSGWDLGGPNDKQDIDDLIEWAVASYTWSGCSSSCIDGDHVGLFGAGGIQGLTALLMGVPGPPGHATHPGPNVQYNERVDGIVAVGYEELAPRNLTALSSDGAATPAWRDIDQGLWGYTADFHSGYFSLADETLAPSVMELIRDKYLNGTISSTTTAWFDDRTVVDDNASVDKAEEITTPVFLANAFLDDAAGITTATLAYNKLGATNKYLYLGACGSSYGQLPGAAGPCSDDTTDSQDNASKLQAKVHEFLDYHVAGNGSALSAKVYWAVPPVSSPLSTDTWSVAEDTTASWPPDPDAYTSTSCLGGDGAWVTGTCGTVSQNTSPRDITNTWSTMPQVAFCAGSTYDASVSYTSGADANNDLTIFGWELDAHVKSNTTRLQVYADMFDVTPGPPEVETRIWQGSAQVVPVKRNGTAGTVYRFKFKPAGVAWTLPKTHKLRLKITPSYKKSFAQELLPATYTVLHTDAEPTHFYLTFDF